MDNEVEDDCSPLTLSGDDFRKLGPCRLKNIVYKEVKVCAATEYQYQGWIYTIDPVSQSIILAQCDNIPPSSELPMRVITGHSISHITVLDEDTSKHKSLLDSLFKNPSQAPSLSHAELTVKKEKLRGWLELHRVPVKECGDNDESLSVSDVLVIEPPYEPDSCLCKNEIILARVQALIRNMQDTT